MDLRKILLLLSISINFVDLASKQTVSYVEIASQKCML